MIDDVHLVLVGCSAGHRCTGGGERDQGDHGLVDFAAVVDTAAGQNDKDLL